MIIGPLFRKSPTLNGNWVRRSPQESTPDPRLNRAAELASFWDPQNERNQRWQHAAAKMPRKSNIGRHCSLAYIIDGDILSYGELLQQLNRFLKESCLLCDLRRVTHTKWRALACF